MESRYEFQKRVNQALELIGPEVLSYDESEFWMIRSLYEYLDYYAVEKRLFNTAVALPLARGLHNGTHRKAKLTRNEKSYHFPYVIHPLSVCRMLADMNMDLSHDEQDILLAAALCHDMIEDIQFPDYGRELTDSYHLDPRVYETVFLLSKRYDFTPEEERDHFHGIESNKLSLLIKLSDRGNNVEDLYNRSCWKVHEYVGETRNFFIPMIYYGFRHFPELTPAIEVLHDKIVTLTGIAELLVDRYEKRMQELEQELNDLQNENDLLRAQCRKLWME